jgi:hypothetical protein
MSLPTNSDGDYFESLADELAGIKGIKELYQRIVDLPFEDRRRATMLSMEHMILVLVNKKTQTIDRIALSDTESARRAVFYSVLPFEAIKIPLSNKENYLGIAIRTHQVMATSDWKDTFTPVLTPDQARMNQAGAGAGCTIVYPLEGVGDGAAFAFSFYEPLTKISKHHHDFMREYTKVAAHELKKRQLVFSPVHSE